MAVVWTFLKNNEIIGNAQNLNVWIRDDSVNSGDELKNKLNGVYLEYELETPITTKLSSAMIKFIKAYQGGTITFTNLHKLSLPIEFSYYKPNIDAVLDETSEHAVQNGIVTKALNEHTNSITNNDKRLTANALEIARINEIIHNTVVRTVEEDFSGNKFDIPKTARIGELDYTVVDNQKFILSKIVGKTWKSKNLWQEGNVSGVQLISKTLTKPLPAGTYTISVQNITRDTGTESNYYLVNAMSGNQATPILLKKVENYTKTFVLDKEVNKFDFYASINFGAGADIKVDYTNIQIEEGSSATPYVPYFSGLKDSTVKNIESVGKNLWDEQWEQGSIGDDGNPISSSTTIRSKNFIKVEPNTKYFLFESFKYFYDENKTFISQTATPDFTTPSNCHYLKFRKYDPDYGGTYKNDIILNEGSLQIPYTPYVGGVSPDLNVTLKGVGNVGDELLVSKNENDEFYTVKQRNKMNSRDVSTDIWYKGSNNRFTYSKFASDNNAKLPSDASSISNLLNSIYNTDTFDNVWLSQVDISISLGPEGTLVIRDTTITTKDELKAKLKDNPIVYELNTPTETIFGTKFTLEQVSILAQQGGYIKVNKADPLDSDINSQTYQFDINYYEKK